VSAHRTHLAFLLHMHQPLYVDPETGRAAMPWVRLHGARSYLDVAWLLEQFPRVSLTVNFVPSLVQQLEAVVAGAPDAYEELARQPSWTPDERVLLLKSFFSVHWARNIEPRPRYRELLEKRGRKVPDGELPERARQFTDGELRDLTVLFHLAWLGFAARAIDPTIAALEKKGRDFNEADLATALAAGRAACAKVLPLYRALAARGQVELSSSPYYHPIVPLLVDSEVAHRAMPGAHLPERFSWPLDARLQIARGRDAHEKTFGAPPRGMWPPEGSLSPEAIAVYHSEGIGWLATDEGNLWRSLSSHGGAPRSALYRPYRTGGLEVVFRDRDLSDRIGFSYAFGDTQPGVDDLLGRARHAGYEASGSDDPPLVSVILDGENPWEAYPGSGEPFLRALFTSLEKADDLRATSIGGHLAAHPAREELAQVHSGSWIDSDFHIWIADPVKNRAWDLLSTARRQFQRAVDGGAGKDRTEPALEHLLAAEGSDWFWWFGEPFHSAEDATFDRLFRAHLAAAYRALGETPPTHLAEPVDRRAAGEEARQPRGLTTPIVDGKVSSYFEWLDAGCYDVPRGAAMAQGPLVTALRFGYDRARLYLRLDPTVEGRTRLAGATVEILVRDLGREVRLTGPITASTLRMQSRAREGEARFADGGAVGAMAFAEIVEVAVPFASIGFAAGARFEVVVSLLDGEVLLGRYPRDLPLALRVPDENFAADHWSV
jgi:alpha-amylase/alpha-mannosidase (GH57 family)